MQSELLIGKALTYEMGGQQLFKHLDFSFATGQIIGIKGPSGCGKTSLLRMLAGLQPPTSGTLYWDQKLIEENLADYRLQTAYLPQKLLFPQRAVRDVWQLPELLGIVSAQKSVSPESAGSKIQSNLDHEWQTQLFDQLGLQNQWLERNVDELSGGQMQRLLIVRLLLLERRIYLLDEPTGPLDRENIEKFIKYIKGKSDTLFIMVSHETLLLDACDRVLDGGNWII